jgi:ComEC/Rec2-related protein
MCSFSPSVVRASIMAIIVLMSGLFGKQYDFVNSISLSGIVILLFSPLSAFDIGFQLSFLSVFSIAFVYPILTKFLNKTKLPKFLTDSFALTCCVQIGLLPLTVNYFGQMSLLSIFANMICIPLFEIAFIGTFVTTIFASIITPLGICFIPFKYIMNFITLVATFVSNQALFMIKLDSISFASVLCFYCGVFLVGDYVNLKKSIKFGACLFLIAISFFYGTIMAIPKQYNMLSILQYQSTCHIIISKNNNKLMLTNDDDIPYDFTNRCKINKVDFLISSKTETTQIQEYYDIKQKSVYGTDVVLDDFNIKYINLLNKLSFIQIKVDGYTIWYMTRTLSDVEEELLEDLPQPNIVINKNCTSQDIADYKLTSNGLITPNKLVTNNNFGFEIKDGRLNKYWSLN